MHKNFIRTLLLTAALVVVALPAAAQSSMYLGEATYNAETRVLSAPIFIEGNGTIDGDALQSLAFRLVYQPADAIIGVRVIRDGLLKDAVPMFEAMPRHENTVSYMGMFPRAQNADKMAFKSSHGDRNLIARVELAVGEHVTEGSDVSLSLDEKISTLANLDGTREHSFAKGKLNVGPKLKLSIGTAKKVTK